MQKRYQAVKAFLTDPRWKTCAFSVLAFGLIAHAYGYFAIYHSGDSLEGFYRTDDLFQIGLGRFLQPFYTHLRGLVGVPWLCGLISLAWIAAALCLIADLFQVRRKSTLVLMGALLATAPMLAFCNAGYFNFTDIFMCAFFLSVLAVWLMRRFRWGFLAGAVCLVGSLGLYQSFMASACGLVTMLFILDALDGRTGPRGLAATALKGGGMALLGGVLYKLGMEAALRLTGVEASTAYNTVAYVGNYDQYSILQLIADTYRYVAEYLFDWLPVHPRLYMLGSVVLLALAVWAVVRLIARGRGRSPLYAVAAVAALVALPFLTNVTYFISKYMHDLMNYPLALLPAFALVLVERARKTQKKPRDWPVWAAAAGVALGMACSVVFSNTAYLRKQVEFDSTVAAVNRIVMTLEQTDGYVVGETPVAWVGDLGQSDAVVYRDGLGELRGYGVSGSYAIGHYRTIKPFFTQVMGYPLALVSEEETETLAESEAVQAMPVFPNKGYCQLVDGVMVIRLSE